jgi:hypothetical protein
MSSFGGQMPRIGFRLRAVPSAFKIVLLPSSELAGGMGPFFSCQRESAK